MPREYKRRFVRFGDAKENLLDSNLTELLASQTVDAGYINHTDWMGHINRYALAMKTLPKEKAMSLLDVGCGQMQMLHFFWKNRMQVPAGFQYWGMDLRAQNRWISMDDPANLAKNFDPCQYKGDVTLVNMDIVLKDPSKIKDWPGSFDVVTCMETLEHVPREHAPTLVGRLFEWTVPGGVCLLSTPNAGASTSTAENHIGPDRVSREWSYEDKVKMVTDTGFVIEASYGVFARWKDRIMPRLIQEGKVSADGKTILDPFIRTLKEYQNHSIFMTTVCAPYPELSNNAIMVLRKPGNRSVSRDTSEPVG